MKALTLLLYCVYEGSEDVASWLRRNLHLVKTLREFRFADFKNIDQGGPIRTKAKVLTELIENPDKLVKEKENYKRIRREMGQPGILELSGNANGARRSYSAFNDVRGGNGVATTKMSLDLGNSTDRGFSPPKLGSGTNNNNNNTNGNGTNSSNNNNSNNKRQSGRGSFEGRYSLSLTTPLHAIEEENGTDLVQIASREVLNLD